MEFKTLNLCTDHMVTMKSLASHILATAIIRKENLQEYTK